MRSVCSFSMEQESNWIQISGLKVYQLARAKHGPHFLSNGSGYVNLKSVLSDLLIDLERAHCFRYQGSNWAQLISVVFPLVDQYALSYFEQVVCPFAVTTFLRPCLLVVQRTVDK